MRRLLSIAGCVLLLMPTVLRAQDAPFPPTNGDPFDVAGTPKQEQTPKPFKLSVTTREVVLDVVVTDKKRNLVKRDDLKPGDFTVLEEKQPQRVRGFEPPSAHQM